MREVDIFAGRSLTLAGQNLHTAVVGLTREAECLELENAPLHAFVLRECAERVRVIREDLFRLAGELSDSD